MYLTSHITPHYHLPLLLLLRYALVGECFSETVAQQEHDALTTLMLSFGNPLLSANWSGSQCSRNHSTWFGIGCTDNRVTSIALQGIGLSGRIDDPLTLAPLTELTLLSLRNNLISGFVLNFSFNLKLTSLDLSVNSLTGPIPDSLLHLNKLELLQLSDNKLNGSIPPFNQTSLRAFNVSNNDLTGEIPTTAVLQLFNQSSYLGNPGLCGEPTSISCQSLVGEQQQRKEPTWLFSGCSLKVLFIVADFILLLALSWSLFMLYRKTRESKKIANAHKGAEEADKNQDVKTNSVQNSIQNGAQDRAQNSMQISIQQRVEAAEEERKLTFVNRDGGFDLDHLLKASAEGLGKGSFGSCYKAALDDGRMIVVKRLRDLRPLTKEEFIQNVSFLGALEHPNLMPLLGYYYSPEEKLLIYNFAAKGNLFNRIHRGRGTNRTPFKWSSRLAVALGVARAMEYLHLDANALTVVPHGNLWSPNVLLDEDNVAKVSDYGLISLIAPSLTAQRMAAYKTPEYDHKHKVSKMSDVWSYGCLLLELLTGRSPGLKGVQLHHWVHRAVREEWTGEVLDREIATQREAVKGMFDLLKLALSCCETLPEKRPQMGEVVRAVEKIKNSTEENDSTEESSLMEESISE